jgi:hypothetical protein
MAYSKNQPVEQQAEYWTACKLSVISQSGFKCESPLGNSESTHKLIRAVWEKGKLNVQEQMMAFFISFDKKSVGYHATFMRTVGVRSEVYNYNSSNREAGTKRFYRTNNSSLRRDLWVFIASSLRQRSGKWPKSGSKITTVQGLASLKLCSAARI